MGRDLDREIPPGLVHPIEHDQVRAGLDPRQRLMPARIDLDGADHAGFTRNAGVLRAVLPLLPGRADAADEIERSVEVVGQGRGDLAVADAVLGVGGG